MLYLKLWFYRWRISSLQDQLDLIRKENGINHAYTPASPRDKKFYEVGRKLRDYVNAEHVVISEIISRLEK